MKHLDLGAPVARLKIEREPEPSPYRAGVIARIEGRGSDPGVYIRSMGTDAINEFARGYADGGYLGREDEA